MKKDRRQFLKLSATAGASLLPVVGTADDTPVAVDCSEAMSVLVDTTLCIGCRQCELACNQANNLCEIDPTSLLDQNILNQSRRPDKCAYTVVNRFSDPAKPDLSYLIKVQCMHCLEPTCVSACIVGALNKDPQGPVVYDEWKCIGCRYCLIACPFQIPAYEYDNPLDPLMRKCTFCFERFNEIDFRPACVSVCPGGALTFGTREMMIDLAMLRIKRSPDKYVNHIYGQHEVGGTSWMYLAGVDIANTQLPKLGDQPISTLTEKIQHGLFKSFVPPLALYGLLGLIMHSLRMEKPKDGENHEL